MSNVEFIDVFTRKLKPFNYFLGGRGIGKTYSALSHCIEDGLRFIYARNTIKQLKLCSTQFGNPFKRLNTDKGWDVHFEPEGDHSLIIHNDKLVGYGVAMSDFENARGVDLSDCTYCIYEEFIQRKGKLAFNQHEAFSDFYETVGRNRELLGEEPFRVIFLSNSQKLGNPIMAGYNLIPHLERLIAKGGGVWRDSVTHIEYFPELEISKLKKDTALYRAMGNSRLSREFLSNEFAHDSFLGVHTRPLREYLPYCAIDDIYIYRHKSANKYYATRSQFTASAARCFSAVDNLPLFMRQYGVRLKDAYIDGRLEFSEYYIKMTLANIFKL